MVTSLFSTNSMNMFTNVLVRSTKTNLPLATLTFGITDGIFLFGISIWNGCFLSESVVLNKDAQLDWSFSVHIDDVEWRFLLVMVDSHL